ncbi:unnamed protein product [Ixodes hexagonus]
MWLCHWFKPVVLRSKETLAYDVQRTGGLQNNLRVQGRFQSKQHHRTQVKKFSGLWYHAQERQNSCYFFCVFYSVENSFPRTTLKFVILMAVHKLTMPTQQAANCAVCYVLSCHNASYVLIY